MTIQLAHHVESNLPNDLIFIQEPNYAEKVVVQKNIEQIKAASNSDSCIYKLLLAKIQLTIVLLRTFQIIMLQIYYFFALKYQPTNKIIKEKLVDINQNFTPPSHVCIILNENLKDKEKIYQTFYLIADALSLIGVKNLSFYQFDG